MAKTKPYDAADYLETEEDVVDYVTESLAEGDAATVAHALGAVARAREMSRTARETVRLSRDRVAPSPDDGPAVNRRAGRR